MHASVRKRTEALSLRRELLLSLNSLANKEWVRRVPAAAVIPALQVMITITGFKAFVAGFASPW